MLHDFLAANRALLIERCGLMVAARSEPKTADRDLAQGIPIFFDQLIGVLASEQQAQHGSSNGKHGTDANAEVGETARRQGRRLLEQGFTLEQVVRNYGDVCQAVTSLAFETGEPVAVDEFRTLNRCLDNAIAGAVTQYTRPGTPATGLGAETVNARLGPLAQELGDYLQTAIVVISAIKAGHVGISGATAAVLDRSLLGMRRLIDHLAAEARIDSRILPR
jgi:hypothetical protein